MKVRKALEYPRMKRRNRKIIIARLDPSLDIVSKTRSAVLRRDPAKAELSLSTERFPCRMDGYPSVE